MPGNSCSVCRSSWNNTVSMFSPPRDKHIRAKWEAACGVKLRKSSRLCSFHFTANDFKSANPKRVRLQPDAVPSLNFSKANVKRRTTDKKKIRASFKQLLFFVNFAHKHPKMLTTKFGAVSDLWEELASNLNSMDGACRSAEKWKDSMSTWRSQLRARARGGKSSGIPQIDEFALRNFGQHAENELDEIAIKSTNNERVEEDTADENMVKNPNNMKDMLKMELCNNKIEIESSDDDNSRHEDSETNVRPTGKEVDIEQDAEFSDESNNSRHEDSETNVRPTGKEVDIEHDAELSDESNSSFESNPSNTVEDNQTLNCLRISRSKVFVIPRKTVTKEKEKAKIFIIPRTSTQNNTPTTADSATRKQSEPANILNKALTNTSTVAFSSEALANTDSIQTTSTGVLSQAAAMPEAQVLGNAPPKKRKLAMLNEMYETVLESMTRRDQRDEQFITVIQGLTDAVTKMADNVKRLEQVLTFSGNDL